MNIDEDPAAIRLGFSLRQFGRRCDKASVVLRLKQYP
jgi:hypothetical protein